MFVLLLSCLQRESADPVARRTAAGEARAGGNVPMESVALFNLAGQDLLYHGRIREHWT